MKLQILNTCVILGAVSQVACQKSSPSTQLILEERAHPGRISESDLVSNLHSRDNDLIRETLWVLQTRKSSAGLSEAVFLLKSKDDYIWLNAAVYLGMNGREESVPYLIKALRHTAYRDRSDRIKYLEKITGVKMGDGFMEWKNWYEKFHGEIQIDWESGLGSSPQK